MACQISALPEVGISKYSCNKNWHSVDQSTSAAASFLSITIHLAPQWISDWPLLWLLFVSTQLKHGHKILDVAIYFKILSAVT